MDFKKLAIVYYDSDIVVFDTKQTALLTANHDTPQMPILWFRENPNKPSPVVYLYRLISIETLCKIYTCRKSIYKKSHSNPRCPLHGYANPLLAVLWEQGIPIDARIGRILSGDENE